MWQRSADWCSQVGRRNVLHSPPCEVPLHGVDLWAQHLDRPSAATVVWALISCSDGPLILACTCPWLAVGHIAKYVRSNVWTLPPEGG